VQGLTTPAAFRFGRAICRRAPAQFTGLGRPVERVRARIEPSLATRRETGAGGDIVE
jgi:hypothetical protein